MTSKTGKKFDEYFGSSERVKAWKKPHKVILFESERKSHVRFAELMTQVYFRFDEANINSSYNIRLRKEHLKGLSDDHIYEICEDASRVLEMQLKRRSRDVQGREDLLLLMQLNLWKPEGKGH